MQIAGTILIVIAAIIWIIGEILFLAAAFRRSLWWLLACLFLSPIAEIVFLILHWKAARKAFLIQVVGVAILLSGVYVQNNFAFTSNQL
jgi:hypothetical protein